MTRDDIIRMAREAGFRAGHIELYNSDPVPFVAGFGLCLWLVQRAERIKDKTKAEAKP